MTVSYEKLWILLLKRKMNRTELAEKSGIAKNTMAKMWRGETTHMDVLLKICETLNCKLDDIIEIID
jgi:DNA-binding Xre family transcriptional regulator